MVADVFTGVIFALLPGNTLLLAMTMFNTEHVNILFVEYSIFFSYNFYFHVHHFRQHSILSCFYGT